MVEVTSGQAVDSSPEENSGAWVQEKESITRMADSNLMEQGMYIIDNKMYNLIKYGNMDCFAGLLYSLVA